MVVDESKENVEVVVVAEPAVKIQETEISLSPPDLNLNLLDQCSALLELGDLHQLWIFYVEVYFSNEL